MQQPGHRSPAPAPLTLVQDLVNTLDVESGQDALATADGLEGFLAAQGLARLRPGPSDLPAVRELREALRAVCLAHTGTDVPPETTAVLDRLLAGAPLVLAIDAAGNASPRPAAGLTGAAALTAEIAAGIATAVADGTWPRLKACLADNCRWVYYDRSPAGRSRWCTMAVCGSRAKMRAYRANRARRGA
ncbi:CGNR zinc finger domain-containing protein [Streptomyces pactum]|uniref:CGNR zinc finger domain-containing protein n=1 Tax=Streptomyces pactum TaxID=68249 RepID=UPI0027DD8060|nr:CGNR zinc finger domain-containing protein [Streptomyces pactum]